MHSAYSEAQPYGSAPWEKYCSDKSRKETFLCSTLSWNLADSSHVLSSRYVQQLTTAKNILGCSRVLPHLFIVTKKQPESSSRFWCLPWWLSSLMSVCLCVCNHGGFPSFLMVIGALEWSFVQRDTHCPPQASGAGPNFDNGLSQNDWSYLNHCMSGGGVCVLVFEVVWRKLQVAGGWSQVVLFPPLFFSFSLQTSQRKHSDVEEWQWIREVYVGNFSFDMFCVFIAQIFKCTIWQLFEHLLEESRSTMGCTHSGVILVAYFRITFHLWRE